MVVFEHTSQNISVKRNELVDAGACVQGYRSIFDRFGYMALQFEVLDEICGIVGRVLSFYSNKSAS